MMIWIAYRRFCDTWRVDSERRMWYGLIVATSQEIRAQADRAARKAAMHQRAAVLREKQAEILYSTAESLEKLERGSGTATARPADATRPRAPDVKRGMTRSRRGHPAQRLLYEQYNMTVAELARQLDESRARVFAWMADGKYNRPIPRAQAEFLRDRYRIPLDVWARVG